MKQFTAYFEQNLNWIIEFISEKNATHSILVFKNKKNRNRIKKFCPSTLVILPQLTKFKHTA